MTCTIDHPSRPRGEVGRHHSCGADRLPVAVRFPAGPRARLKTVDPPKGNGLGQKKICTIDQLTSDVKLTHLKLAMENRRGFFVAARTDSSAHVRVAVSPCELPLCPPLHMVFVGSLFGIFVLSLISLQLGRCH